MTPSSKPNDKRHTTERMGCSCSAAMAHTLHAPHMGPAAAVTAQHTPAVEPSHMYPTHPTKLLPRAPVNRGHHVRAPPSDHCPKSQLLLLQRLQPHRLPAACCHCCCCCCTRRCAHAATRSSPPAAACCVLPLLTRCWSPPPGPREAPTPAAPALSGRTGQSRR